HCLLEASSRLLVVFFFSMIRLPSRSTLFPYTTLFRSVSYVKNLLTSATPPLILGATVSHERRIAKVETEAERQRAVSGDQSGMRSEEHTSELQSRFDLVCRLLLEKKKKTIVHF